jgi:hypothetical protein
MNTDNGVTVIRGIKADKKTTAMKGKDGGEGVGLRVFVLFILLFSLINVAPFGF